MSNTELSTITATLLRAKNSKGVTFADLEKALGRDEVWIAAVIYRQASASADEASKLLHTLGLSKDLADELTASPVKGLGPVIPTDPLIYRFYEIMQVYGMPMKFKPFISRLRTPTTRLLNKSHVFMNKLIKNGWVFFKPSVPSGCYAHSSSYRLLH